jgi:hypothetical protein
LRTALALLALHCLALPSEAWALRRFAVIAGNDEGGPGTRPLVYAREDAKKIHGILTRLGGVRPEDAALILDGTADELLSALARVDQRAREAQARGERTGLIFYYSGHAKDGALRLGRTRLAFDLLKARLATAAADIRIGILDSCQSGMLTRRKGARRAPEFAVEASAGRDTRGLVLLTSSAADEDSQESDLIGGSYFSHHLASGLLGDADRSGDLRVTLAEAYAYAYDRTVADTAASSAGPQHPTFSYDFQGNGDVVLTDLGRGEGLLFPKEAPAGTYFVVDGRGFVSAEVWKQPEVERRLALAPGTYRLKRRLPDRLRVGEVAVRAGLLTRVEESRLRDAPFTDDPVKGAGRPSALGLSLFGTYQSFFDAPTRAGLFPPAPLLGVEAQLRDFLRRDWVWAFDLAAGARRGQLLLGTARLSYDFSEVTLGSSIWAEWPLGEAVAFAGGRVALLVMSRRFDDPVLPRQLFSTFSPGVVVGGRYRLWGPWAVGARGRVHYLLYNVEENRSLGYWELAGSLGYEL